MQNTETPQKHIRKKSSGRSGLEHRSRMSGGTVRLVGAGVNKEKRRVWISTTFSFSLTRKMQIYKFAWEGFTVCTGSSCSWESTLRLKTSLHRAGSCSLLPLCWFSEHKLHICDVFVFWNIHIEVTTPVNGDSSLQWMSECVVIWLDLSGIYQPAGNQSFNGGRGRSSKLLLCPVSAGCCVADADVMRRSRTTGSS